MIVDINGNSVEFPDDLAPDALNKAVAAAAQQMSAPAAQPQRGIVGKAWDALAVPEQKSMEGLNMLAGYVPKPEPTGNLVKDVAKGTPRVLADTLAEAAPGFVSRGSILTAGGAKVLSTAAPAAKAVMRGMGTQGESLSGAVPGSLEAAYKDASLMGAKGKKAVSAMYETAKTTTGGIRKDLQMVSDRREAVDKALKLAEEGSLNPYEALESRKELVKIKKQVPNAYFQYAKDKFNAVAKTVFGKEDAAYQRANMAESLRNFFPQNKYGGTSAFKLGIASLANHEGTAGKIAALLLSPAFQGATATAAGLAGRHVIAPAVASPRIASALTAALQYRKNRNGGK